MNTLLQAVEAALAEQGRKLLLIVEDLDKLQLADAYEVFVNHSHLRIESIGRCLLSGSGLSGLSIPTH